MMKINKKGAEYTTSTIIVIVLALLVLVVLAMGFGAGWSNLWSKITGFFSPVNVDSVKQACSYACSTQSLNAYCCQVRDVRFVKGEKPEQLKCNDQKLQVECTDINCASYTGCNTASGGVVYNNREDAVKVCDTNCNKIDSTTIKATKDGTCNAPMKYKLPTNAETSNTCLELSTACQQKCMG